MQGFFRSHDITKGDVGGRAASRAPRCGVCGLRRSCQRPRMPCIGKGRRKILIVAECPSKAEDETGVQMTGEASQMLLKHLEAIGIDLNTDCWKTNAVVCKTKEGKTPTQEQIEACRPYLFQDIERLQPNVIVCLGGTALSSLVGLTWKEGHGGIAKWAGHTIPSQNPNVWIVPTYHPSYLLREDRNQALQKWFREHLKKARDLSNSIPWPNGPRNYADEVRVILDASKASRWLRSLSKQRGTISFDYETNCLNPNYKGARIFTCSVCWEGKRTMAFPWTSEIQSNMMKILRTGRIKKVAANLKFEDRWSNAVGMPVRGWTWDTMVAAHFIDNRPQITSLKFQAYAHLGCPSYEEFVKPYLQKRDGSHLNRISQAPMKDLLLYNGLDSLLEYELAKKQKEQVVKMKVGRLPW